MSRVVEISDMEEESSFITSNPSAIIFFGSVRCSHCRAIAPIYEKLSQKYGNVAFGHVETSLVEVNDLAGVPTFAAYKGAVPVDKLVGASEKGLISLIESLNK